MSEPADENTSGTEDTVAADPIVGPEENATSPAQPIVPRYEVLDELARGPGSRVVRARDRQLARVVAIKSLRATAEANEANETSFEREIRITARLQHPSIVQIHDAGRWPGGEPFFAMKLVAGRPLDRVITDAKTPDERLALLPRAIAVADALAYAHVEGVVHRAIEPANVLCAEHGETIVIDWGTAKELADSDFDLESTTRARGGAARSAFHAPAYMPPEQAKNIPVNARGDVYSLGALLYHLLSGIPPYQGRDADAVIASVLAGPPPSLRIRASHVPPQLIAIVDKAMARDPQQRYASAKQMADDLRRFEAAQLVAIPSGAIGAIVASGVRRNRKAVMIGAGALVALIVIVVLATRGGDNTARPIAIPSTGSAVPENTTGVLSGQVQAARVMIDADPTEALAMLDAVARSDDAATVLDDLQLVAADASSRAVAHVLAGKTRVNGLAVSPDDKLVAAAGVDLQLWRLAPEWKHHGKLAHDHEVLDVVFVDASTLVSVDSVGTVRRWSVAKRTAEVVRAGAGTYRRATLAPTGDAVVVFAEFEAELWKFDGKTADRPLAGCTTAAWSSDGGKVAHNTAHQIELRDLATGEVVHTEPAEGASVTSLATDGNTILIGGLDGNLRSAAGATHRHTGPVTSLLALAGGTLITASSDHETRTTTGRRFVDGDYTIIVDRPAATLQLRGHRTNIDAVAASRSGMIASAGRDGTIRVWRMPPEAKRIPWSGGAQRPHRASITADFREVVLGRSGPMLDVVDRTRGAAGALRTITPPAVEPQAVRIEVGPNGERVARPLSVPKSAIQLFETSLDGRKIVTLDDTWSVIAWDLAAGTAKVLGTGYRLVAISGDGAKIAAAGRDNTLRVWDSTTAKLVQIANSKIVNALALDAIGALLGVAFDDGTVGLFDTSSSQPPRVLAGPRDRLGAIRFVSSTHVIAGGAAGELRAWDLATGTMTTWKAHDDAIQVLLVSRHCVATIGADHALQSFAFADHQRRKPIAPRRLWHGTLILSATLLDDPAVLTIGDDRAVRLWSANTPRIVTRHPGRVLAAARADGHVISVDDLGDIVETPDPVPHDLAKLRSWLAASTNMKR